MRQLEEKFRGEETKNRFTNAKFMKSSQTVSVDGSD
jgi:hypothetical protein